MINHEMKSLPVRKCSIVCIEHPEWGTWGVMEDRGGYYEIFGKSGWRVLDKDEAVKFWTRVEVKNTHNGN